MIDELRAIAIFAETIKQGSFRAAAKVLKLSPSVVSYHITQLEKTVGTALIYRSTRNLSLTYEGSVLYQHAQEMLQAAQQGLEKITSEKETLIGSLSVTLPSALIKAPLSKKLAEFSKLHPKLSIKLVYSDVRQDIISDGVDLALRAGTMSDSNLKAKLIGQINRKLVCSSEYKKEQQKNITIDDLMHWNWIKLDMLPAQRTLINSAGQRRQINFKSNISVNSVEAMTQLCINGVGIATPPDFLVSNEIVNNELVELLPHWQVEPIPLYAVWPNNITQSSNTKRLLAYLLSP